MPLILSFAVAVALTAACIPLLLRWSGSIGLTDAPGPRKVHTAPIPRIGGIAMAIGILVPTMLGVELSPRLVGLLAGVAVLLVFGVWDDRSDLDFRLKFAGQSLAVGLCMLIGDIRIESLTLVERLPLPPYLGLPLTFVFLVGVTNAVNLSDGLDGLAGGMALLCLSAIALLAAHSGNSVVVAFALIEAGAILGFLRFNTYPAKCFMGDSGSQVLGFSIGVLSILATQGETASVSTALPLLIVGIPIFDTLNVMSRRIHSGRSPFSPDRNHLHHRLLALGFGHAGSVCLIYLLQIASFLLAYYLRYESDLTILAAFLLLSAAVLTALWAAEAAGWHAGGLDALPIAGALRRLRRSPVVAAPWIGALRWAAGGAIFLYAVLVITHVARVAADVALLCAALFILLLVSWRRISSPAAGWIERAAAYVGTGLLVYLDVSAAGRGPWFVAAAWMLVLTAAIATLGFVMLDARRRFEVTALDLLIVTLALVIPNLPGAVALAPEQAAGIAKAIILIYAVEMLHGIDLRAEVRAGVVATLLGVVAVRGLVTLLA